MSVADTSPVPVGGLPELWVDLTEQPVTEIPFAYVCLLSATATSLTNTVSTAVGWDTLVYQSSPTMWSAASPSRINIPESGRYEITFSTAMTPSAPGPFQTRVIVNNNERVLSLSRTNAQGAGSGATEHGGSVVLDLVAGDYVFIQLDQTTGSAQTAVSSYVSVTRIPEPYVGTTQPRSMPVGLIYSGVASTLPTGVTTKLNFTQVDFDTDSMADLTNDRFTIRTPGVYRVTGVVSFQGPTTPAGYRSLAIYKNNSQLWISRMNALSTASVVHAGMTVTGTSQCSAGDYFDLRAGHTQGADLVTQPGSGPGAGLVLMIEMVSG